MPTLFPAKMTATAVVIHYHEIALKGNNRRYFEKKLQRNIMRATASLGMLEVRRLPGRLLGILSPQADWPQLRQALQQVFGVAYFAPTIRVPQDLEAIKHAARELLQGKTFASFKVETKRAQKAFAWTSPQVNAALGEYLCAHFPAKVDLTHPEVTLWVEIADDYALLYCERVAGAGGLPVGTSERAVCLISGGIDSPVAAYRLMRRGVKLIFVHFHSAPFTSTASQRLVERQVQLLTRFQFLSSLYLLPFAEVQRHLVAVCPPSLRVILYRRAMLRLAERIAQNYHAPALVTGDNVAQVASQTLSNLHVISAAVGLPVIRPLAGEDKQDIIAQARQIGTYAISIEPYEDCCSLFAAPNPETHARLETVRRFEAMFDLEAELGKALQQAVIKRYRFRRQVCEELPAPPAASANREQL
ncbi:MAG: tRNA 4-thiouridine(8) synthase ThiI [candidate division KSB1 bacterium]|nr:tRNA 4-thiouridine(8) synthase ThiI [candidate division KSB1 bacterium]MDZ7275434.1 tRNA 4-thiouridine(8) synthase ThiI [candidate division KSB1 bacterium]MDZ7286253.1 tRNA 4-thiouridine(8) synthase ThiI [candidate division KSB1 bacterium]MDZ7296479.1 tRNA 4-thiouridine(8) synthase ThiI [candidate division KSB1 bacterium]MDZ7305562.1 tRNA 4-thiouridine(8) synthase ThiI [candidate division KSB1 bacterium]